MRVGAKAYCVASTGVGAGNSIFDDQPIDARISSASAGDITKITKRSVAVLYDVDFILNLLLFFRIGLRIYGILLVCGVLSWAVLIRVVLVRVVLTRVVLIV